MSQTAVVSRLAIHELWITFRLLLLVAVFIAAGAAVALLPAPLPVVMQRLAGGLGAATLVAGTIAAWSFATERQAGRTGWLVTRSVRRGTVVVGWIAAVAGVSLASGALAGMLGWLAASAVALRLDPGAFAMGFAGGLAVVLPAVSLGVALGAALPAPPAAAATLVTGLAVGATAWLVPGAAELVPGGGLLQLASLDESGISTGASMRSAGVALLTAAGLVVLARAAIGRVEL